MSREYGGDGSLLASDFIMGLFTVLAQLEELMVVVGKVSLKSSLIPPPLKVIVVLLHITPS